MGKHYSIVARSSIARQRNSLVTTPCLTYTPIYGGILIGIARISLLKYLIVYATARCSGVVIIFTYDRLHLLNHWDDEIVYFSQTWLICVNKENHTHDGLYQAPSGIIFYTIVGLSLLDCLHTDQCWLMTMLASTSHTFTSWLKTIVLGCKSDFNNLFKNKS